MVYNYKYTVTINDCLTDGVLFKILERIDLMYKSSTYCFAFENLVQAPVCSCSRTFEENLWTEPAERKTQISSQHFHSHVYFQHIKYMTPY